MSDEAVLRIKNNFPTLTPQMFGAIGDGVHDDTDAFQMMMDVHAVLSSAIQKQKEQVK